MSLLKICIYTCTIFLFSDLFFNFYQEQKDEVKKRCIQAEPRHGELWQAASKDVKNWRKRTGELLEIIADKLEIPK